MEKARGINYSEVTEIVKIKQVVQECTLPFERLVSSTLGVAEVLMKEIGQYAREALVVLGLNAKNEINTYAVVFTGGLNHSIAQPREIMQILLLGNCARFIVAHNHPSGDCRPSPSDDAFTKKMKKVGALMGVDLLDHIIVGPDSYHSYRETGFWKK